MRLLVANTYAGSLLLAAERRKDEVIASLEDANYGGAIQLANFPRLNYYPTTDVWPEYDLTDTVVIAHPPCAAFSSQNRGSAAMRGFNAPKVRCTEKVVEYALKSKAAALAVESVPRALVGLWFMYDGYAKKYGYDVYRISLNAGSLGVAQYRPRFWAVLVRKGLVKNLKLTMEPKRREMKDIISDYDGCCLTELPWVKEHTEEQLERVRQSLNSEKEFNDYLKTARGSVVKTLPDKLKLEKCDGDVYECACARHVETRRAAMGWNFTSHSMVMLNPSDLAPTLLAGSWWFYKTRALVAEEYKQVMDFPRDYVFPGEYYLKRTREYLSRGVAPATAEWILNQIESNLTGKELSGSLKAELEPNDSTVNFWLTPKARREAVATEVILK
ncbi:MAG TPA: DNA cytosine methyltransferase [Chloroflexota bacterium]|nr:DNA cytosine methyltransferase [Chloroflexota bacterium]